MSFTVIPAIDVRERRVVRLAQGDYARETAYEPTPIDLAVRYGETGARHLHLVDLDAARLGVYSLIPLVKEIDRRTALLIQTGGGVRREDDVRAILDAGAHRVVVGTVAVREPALVMTWIKAFGPEKITLALDARQDETGTWQLPVRGWTEASGRVLEPLLREYADAGLKHVLCTDIDRDGMLSGFNLELYAILAERFPDLEFQASGGVRGLDDIRAAKSAGARAAILGRALLEGRFDLRDALQC